MRAIVADEDAAHRPLGVPRDQDRPFRVLDDALAYAAEHHQSEVRVPLGPHHDEVALLATRDLEDRLDRMAPLGDGLGALRPARQPRHLFLGRLPALLDGASPCPARLQERRIGVRAAEPGVRRRGQHRELLADGQDELLEQRDSGPRSRASVRCPERVKTNRGHGGPPALQDTGHASQDKQDGALPAHDHYGSAGKKSGGAGRSPCAEARGCPPDSLFPLSQRSKPRDTKRLPSRTIVAMY